jgi:hypothetical protein
MKKVTLILTLAAFCVNAIFAQTEASTTDGKKVILNDDGTWKYAEQDEKKVSESSECSELIKTETDKVTGQSTVMAMETIVISEDGGKSGLGIFCILHSS